MSFLKTDWAIFVERLNALIVGRGLQQNQLSADTGISPAAINNYLKGRRIPNADSLFILADYFQVTVEWLSGKNDNQKAPAPQAPLPAEPNSDLTVHFALLPPEGLRILAGWLESEAQVNQAIQASLESFFNSDTLRNTGFLVPSHRTETSALNTALRTLGQLAAQASA